VYLRVWLVTGEEIVVTQFEGILRRCAFASAALFLAAAPPARGQNTDFQPGAADAAAAAAARRYTAHPLPSNTPAASKLPKAAKPASGQSKRDAPFQNDRSRAIGDLTYQGGPVVLAAQSHPLYVLNKAVNCSTPDCWGNPEQFLKDLAGSEFIHIADQYTGRNSNNQYILGAGATINVTLPQRPLTDLDMLAIVHAVASQTHQTGYDHIYHVFLPPGTDECFDSTFTICYSPDKPATFFFCAYHSSVDFTDIGHVLYSVEPFQNVPGCNVSPGSPNGQLTDSTDSVLSHELFETITDPNGTGWWNTESNELFGDEIADECIFLIFTPVGAFFDPPVFNIGKNRYAVQMEYNNFIHACSTAPHGN
jgi:hypothetical protein